MQILKIIIPSNTPEHQEVMLAQITNQFEMEGFEQNDNELIAYIKDENYNSEHFKSILGTSFTVEKLENQNWNALWESNFEPVIVNQFCGIRAHFHPPMNTVQYEIMITPKMSFGTGHHATTYQVIEAMQSLDFTDKLVCDFGTGTGVLAILAEKLGAKEIIAIDNDDWSIENTKENIIANNCIHIKCSKGEQIIENQYDIILANINKNVLLANMAALKSNLKNDGVLILSGILKEDLEDMVDAISKEKLSIAKLSEKSNWLCIVLKSTSY